MFYEIAEQPQPADPAIPPCLQLTPVARSRCCGALAASEVLVKSSFSLMLGLALLAGCDRPEGGRSGAPARETFNPPKDSTNVLILTASIEGGKPYKFEVPRAVIEGLPDGSPTSETIPLPPQRAAQLALSRYKSLAQLGTNDIETSAISLQTISWFHSKWAYHISFVPRDGARSSPEHNDLPRTMVVLLNGTVVNPVIDRSPQRGPKIHLWSPPTKAWSRPEPAVQASGNSCVSGGWLSPLMLAIGQHDTLLSSGPVYVDGVLLQRAPGWARLSHPASHC
jgi:hypothetical protein